MKVLFVSISMLAFFGVSGQEIKFKVGFSENYALFEFVSQLSSQKPNSPFKKVFDNSKYSTSEYMELISEFSSLPLFYWYEYPEYPFGSKIGGSTLFILRRNLIESSNLDEFKQKTFGLIPNHDLNRLHTILSKFLNVYRELVYEPNEKKFQEQLNDIRNLINSTKLDAYVGKVINFHRSSWDFNKPFITSLYPIPDDRSKGFTATAFYNHAIAGIPLGLKNFELLLSVMFHEAFHILYDEQPLEVKSQISSWFQESSSISARYAELLFNESITTSIANGYVYHGIKGSYLKGEWYNNHYISQMAQKVYPLLKEYIENGKPMDKEFVNFYISQFDNEWLTDLSHLTMNRFIISDSIEHYDQFQKLFRYFNIEESKNELNLLTLQELKKLSITKIVIVSKDNRKKLDLIKNSFPELSNWNIAYESDFCKTQFLSDRTYLIIANLREESLEQVMQNIDFELIKTK